MLRRRGRRGVIKKGELGSDPILFRFSFCCFLLPQEREEVCSQRDTFKLGIDRIIVGLVGEILNERDSSMGGGIMQQRVVKLKENKSMANGVGGKGERNHLVVRDEAFKGEGYGPLSQPRS